MGTRLAYVVVVGPALWLMASSSGNTATVPLDSLVLSSPADPVNVLTIELDAGPVGSDSRKANLSGSIIAELELDTSAETPVVTGITFNGGSVQATNLTFEFFRGLISVEMSNLAGFPATPTPPGSVAINEFDSSQHEIIINQGMIGALGRAIDLSQAPISTQGEGFGVVELTPVTMGVGELLTYDVEVSLPISGSDTIVVEDLPLVGDIPVDVSIRGVVEATDRITIALATEPMLQAGDANQDLSFDQLDIVQVSAAAKFLSGQPATWGEGDWNGAPGGRPGNAPSGDGVFDQKDIVAALQGGVYLTGRYAALAPNGWQVDNAATKQFLFSELTVVGSIARGADFDDVDLYIPVPEPATVVLALIACMGFASFRNASAKILGGSKP